MTTARRSPSGSEVSPNYKDFLDLPRSTRSGRVTGIPLLPNYLGASVDRHGNLRWPPPPRRGVPLHKPPADLCFSFARLAEGSPEQIRRFAALWGPLGREVGIEQNVNHWKRHARVIQAILRFTAERISGGRGLEKDWETLCEWILPAPPPLERKGMNPREQMAFVCSAINKWFSAAKGNGILALTGQRLQVRAHGSNLFGVIGIQTAYAVARTDQAVVCAGCQEPLRRSRPLSRGDRSYCESCRKKKIPQRDAARDYRQRKKK
jgi:hypothetical protein